MTANHFVNFNPIAPPFPEHLETLVLGLGCYWGAERKYWETPGVWTTAVGFTGGHTDQPDYYSVCSGQTGHAEVVLMVFDPTEVTLEELLVIFWENHDPTQGMRQGNDVGSQYRSAIFVADQAQRLAAEATRDAYAPVLIEAGHGPITTEISDLGVFTYASEPHQQYLAKNPDGYCNLGGTGASCPTGFKAER
ncbi:MAG: peptide-methionine (S)-S-oxide reductase MsrA [Acidimicrobiales bacterium]|nr:peptide-methionine (S)-S-oxide reductase MsrA [Acidimicrobiales bacterium]